jgi:hypothetical protein
VTYTRSPLARIPFPPSIPARSHSARFYSARSYLRHHMVASIGAGVWRGRGIPAEPALAQAGCRGQVAVEARGGAGRAGVSARLGLARPRSGSARRRSAAGGGRGGRIRSFHMRRSVGLAAPIVGGASEGNQTEGSERFTTSSIGIFTGSWQFYSEAAFIVRKHKWLVLSSHRQTIRSFTDV